MLKIIQVGIVDLKVFKAFIKIALTKIFAIELPLKALLLYSMFNISL